MRVRRAVAGLMIGMCSMLFPVSALASSTLTKGHNDITISTGKTHTLEIRCDTQTNKIKISRLAVLNVPRARKAKLDFGITTAHGLLDKSGKLLNSCKILDFEGQSYDLKAAEIGRDYKPGAATDWAMVVFERARGTDVVRYNLASPISAGDYDKLAENYLPLLFSSARGLPDGEQHCQALPRRSIGMNKPRYAGLLPHDCRAVSGQSGAPVSVTRQGQNVILGFHVGNAFWMGIPGAARPARHGYMRVIDDALLNKINKNVALLLETP